MSNTALPALVQTTNVIGYFNGNKWPIHVAISELNITLTLQAGQYVETSDRRKINDPLFDKYTKPFQLNKELSRTPVPLISVPRVTSAATPNGHTHPVSAVSQYVQDATGVRRPVIPQTKQLPIPQPNTSSLRVMSVQEARDLGFIGKARVVPEDYGAEDTGHGVGNAQHIPEIKVAIESNPRIRTVGTLPPELLTMTGAPTQNAALATNLMQTMAKVGSGNPQVEIPGSPNGYLQEARQSLNAPPSEPLAQPSAPLLVLPNGQPASEVLAATLPDAPLPVPNISGFNPSQIAPVQIAVTAPPTPIKESAVRTAAPPATTRKPASPAKASAPKDEKPFVCGVCNQPHRYRSNLSAHAKAKHADQADAILAAYPEI